MAVLQSNVVFDSRYFDWTAVSHPLILNMRCPLPKAEAAEENNRIPHGLFPSHPPLEAF